MNALPDYNLDPPEAKWPSFDELHQDYIDKRAADYIRHWSRDDDAMQEVMSDAVSSMPSHTIADLIRRNDLCELGRALKSSFDQSFHNFAQDYVREEYEGTLPHGARFHVPEFVP